MTYQHIRVEPLSAVIGAEIRDVDLSALAEGPELAEIRRALGEYGVVFFRHQRLTPEQHIAFARCIGEINVNRFFATVPGYPMIAEVCKEPEQQRNIGNGWHTDHSYDEAPRWGRCSMRERCRRPAATLYSRACTRPMTRCPTGCERGDLEGRLRNAELATQDAVHPVVIRHPATGRKALYVNPGFTVRFDGWTEDESRPLLDYLYHHAVRPEFTCRFQWREGSLAFWDNRSTWHFAVNDDHGERRLLHRITIEGQRLS